jgi:hypothetical protein
MHSPDMSIPGLKPLFGDHEGQVSVYLFSNVDSVRIIFSRGQNKPGRQQVSRINIDQPSLPFTELLFDSIGGKFDLGQGLLINEGPERQNLAEQRAGPFPYNSSL